MNRLWFKFLIVTVSLVFASQVRAQSQSTDIRPSAERLMGEDIERAFRNVTHKGSYNFDHYGLASNSYTEEHFPDGRVAYHEGDITLRGQWYEENDNLCFSYENDLMGGGCFRVYQVQNCFYYYSDQIPLTEWELGEDYWTARSVVKGEMPKCEPAIS